MKTPVLALAIAAAAFASSSLYLWSQLRAERASLARVEDATRQLNARIAEFEHARIEVARHGPNARGFVAGQAGPGTVPAPPPVDMPPPGADAEGLARWIAEAPKPPAAMEKAMRSQIRAGNRQRYGDFCEEIGLDEEMTNKLIALISEQDTAGFFRTSSDPGEAGRQLEQLQRQHLTEIADLIGPANAQALKQYQASLPARADVEMLAQQFDGNDVPLSKDQRYRLQEVFIEERARIPMPQLGPGDDTAQYLRSAQEWRDDFSRRVGERANHILNSEQLAVYNEIQQWENEMRDGGGVAMSAAGYAVTTSDVTTFTLPADAVAIPVPSEPPKQED